MTIHDRPDPFMRMCQHFTRKSFTSHTSFLPMCVVGSRQLRINEMLRLYNDPSIANIGRESVEQQWRSLRDRLLHARAMIALADTKTTVNVVLKESGIPLTLFGDTKSVNFAVGNLAEVVEKPLFASLDRRWPTADSTFDAKLRYLDDPLVYHMFDYQRVAAILPIPGPLAGWEHYDGWLAFIGEDVLNRSLVCRDGLDAWVSASISWKAARGNKAPALDRALASRDRDIAKYQMSKRIGA